MPQEALSSPYASKPGSLREPVPGESQQRDVLSELNLVPEALNLSDQMNQERARTPEQEDLLSGIEGLGDVLGGIEGLDQVLGPGGEMAPPEEAQVPETAPEPGFFAANFTPEGIKQQFDDMGLRVQANLAESPESRFLTLKNTLGEENVKRLGKDKDIYFRRAKGEPFRKLDPGTLELVNDIYSDFYRENIEGMFGVAGATIGGGAGTAAAPGAGTAVGGLLGFGAGTAVGSTYADMVGEQFHGVIRAPGEKEFTERVGRAAEKGAWAATLKGGFDEIAGRITAWRGRKAALQKLKDTPEHEILDESTKEVVKTIDEMSDKGLVTNIPGTDTPVMAHQMLTHTPEVQREARFFQVDKAFRTTQQKAAEQMDDAVLDMVETSADLEPGSLRETIRAGVKKTRAGIQGELRGLLEKARAAEGKIIGDFRKKAAEGAKGKVLNQKNTINHLLEFADETGIQVAQDANGGIKLQFPGNDDLVAILGTESKAVINGFKKDFQRLASKASKGGFTVDELIEEVARVKAKSANAYRFGTTYGRFTNKLASNLRKDLREGMPEVLSPDDARLYQGSIQRFRSTAQAQDTLRNLLKDNEVATNTFVKGLLTKGRKGLGQLQAAKTFLLQEDPELWGKISAEFFEELAVKHRTPGKMSIYNAGAMRNELMSYGPEYLDALLPPRSGIDGRFVLRAFDAAERVQQAAIKGSDDKLKQEGIKAIGGLSNFISAKVHAVAALTGMFNYNARLLKLMSRDGVDQFLEQVPKKHKGKMRQTLQALIEIGKQNGVISRQVRDTTATQTGLRQTGLTEAIGAASGAGELDRFFRRREGQ